MHARKILMCTFAILVSLILIGAFVAAPAQETRPAEETADRPPVISGPYTHENLTIYLVHGEDKLGGREFLTLAEALEQKKAKVYETGDVNELSIENLSEDKDLFIQAGDIVRGGKQDRVVGTDLIVVARSDKVSLQSFCVEQGRWSRRGGESLQSFSSSSNLAPSNELKLAIRKKKSQREVWANVSKTQRDLSRNLYVPVTSQASSTSLELSLENETLKKKTSDYVNTLSENIAGKEDALGLVVCVNGKLMCADTYASPRLFDKLRAKLLEAAATEAVASLDGKKEPAVPSIEAVRMFLASSGGKAETTDVSKHVRTVTRESNGTVMFELHDRGRPGLVLHSSTVRKAE